MEPKTEKPSAAPYISPVTFLNSIDLLKPMPPRIDKSVFRSQAGGIQAKIIASFQFLKLIDGNGTPQQLLRDLAQTPKDERQPLIRVMLEGAYAFLRDPDFDVTSTSTQGLEDKFKALNVSGATVRKAIAFFMVLAKDAGLVVSPHVKPTKSGGSGSGTGTRRKARPKIIPPEQPPVQTVQGATGFWDKALDKLPNFDPTMDAAGVANYVKVMELILSSKVKTQGVSEQPGDGNDAGED